MPVPGIPPHVIGLTAKLFDAGMADPRAGNYRQIVLRVANVWGQNYELTTNGWYFAQGFAVCWDGMVHKVLRAGGEADLRRDVEAGKAGSFIKAAAAAPGAEPVGVALLLRLGESGLARLMFDLFSQGPPLPALRRNLDEREWLSTASVSWLSAVFDRAVEAHAVGDDRLAVDVSELLLRARPPLESAWSDLNSGRPGTARSPLTFLDPVPTLLTDSERRLKAKPHPPFDPAATKAMPFTARLSELIERLEDVAERQMSQPGGVYLTGSPICKALADEGVAAVEPLLDVMEHDLRLTRSYSFTRSFFPERHLIGVAEAAEAVLRHQYHLHTFRWKDPAQRREWLIANKNRSQAERYFDLLAGDSNDEVQWLDAAEGLSGALGEELRQHKNPSVSELLAKRVGQMRTTWADNVALLLYRWDPPAALPSLQRVTRASYPGNLFGHIIAARLQLGDASAARDWAAIIRSDRVPPLEQFTPLWTKPDDSTLQEEARLLFIAPDAPLSPSNLLTSHRSAGSLIRSPLLIQPAFRESVLTALARKEVVGTVERLSGGSIQMRIQVRFPDSSMDCAPRACVGFMGSYPPGKRDIRVGDYVAWALSGIQGFPAFDLEAPEQEKDSGITRMAEFLRSHARDLQPSPITTPAYSDPVVTLVSK